MANALASLLDKPSTVVELAVKKLEHLSGYHSTDVHLLADINLKSHNKILDLGLDPNDTAARELYYALLIHFDNSEKQLSKDLGLSSKNPYEFSAKIAEFVSKAETSKKVWVLKKSVAKHLLKQNPPKHLMKILNYRSVDSMLKRENITHLYAAVVLSESGRYKKAFWSSLAKVGAQDFETRDIEISVINKKWKSFASNKEVASVDPVLGALTIWPGQQTINKGSVGLCLALARAVNELKTASCFIKLNQVENKFGSILVGLAKNGLNSPLKMLRQPIEWKTVFNHYGKQPAHSFPEEFGPHLLHEDLSFHSELEMLAKLNPVFSWWVGLEHVAAKFENSHVSFNIADNIINYSQKKSFEQRSLGNFRQSLWHEFIDRYLVFGGVKKYALAEILGNPQVSENNLNKNQLISNKILAGVA